MSGTYSVVITNYNYARFLDEAVTAALGQRLPPLEVIVVDDGSTDGSDEVVAALALRDPRVRLLRKTNGGQLSAFIAGVGASRGDVVAFLDADDVWSEDYLARVDEAYRRNPAVDFVYTNLRYFGARDGLVLPDPRSRDLGYSALLGAFAALYQGSTTSAISMKRALATRLLDLPPATVAAWRTRADDALVFGADTLGARKYYLAEPLVRYRAHGTNAHLGHARDHDADYAYAMRVRALQDYYRVKAGITPAQLVSVRHEFRTKRNPTWRMARMYLRLVDRSAMSWSERLVSRLVILGHFLRNRARLT